MSRVSGSRTTWRRGSPRASRCIRSSSGTRGCRWASPSSPRRRSPIDAGPRLPAERVLHPPLEARLGLGKQAALAVLNRFRGVWELAQLRENHAAIAFWDRVLTEYTRGRFVRALLNGEPGQVFDNRGLSAPDCRVRHGRTARHSSGGLGRESHDGRCLGPGGPSGGRRDAAAALLSDVDSIGAEDGEGWALLATEFPTVAVQPLSRGGGRPGAQPGRRRCGSARLRSLRVGWRVFSAAAGSGSRCTSWASRARRSRQAALEILTRYQGLIGRRNAASSGSLFDQILYAPPRPP